MKVLWITNTVFPDLSKALGNSAPVVGGWMYGLASDLVDRGIQLIVATSRPNMGDHNTIVNGISYYLLKGKKQAIEYDASLEKQWKDLIEKVKPDIIHLHGTEYAHGLSLIKSCPELKYVVSIQGLISVYTRYYTGSIPKEEIKKSSTLRDFVKKEGILQAQKKFWFRGERVEKKYFKLVNDFIGRTSWDHSHCLALNKNARYHFCNESLRDAFYKSEKWDPNNKNEHSIFLSQALYPIKGLHQVIEAVSYLKNDFPDLKIKIAGRNIVKSDSIRDKLALDGYGSYIKKLIRKFQLGRHVEFLGYLDEHQMIEQYLRCHIFICPSSIENSPNSLGEAQILGTPCIASYVGGVPDMVENGRTGLLYRFEEVEMLVHLIKSVFVDDELAGKLSKEGIKEAEQRHNRRIISEKILKIYEDIIQNT